MPLQAPNIRLPLDSPKLRYPLLASVKHDGFRMLCWCGDLLTSSMRPQPNRRLAEHLAELVKLCRDNLLIVEAEIVCPGLPFHALQAVLQSRDAEIPAGLECRVFDCLTAGEWINGRAARFERRYARYCELAAAHVRPVEQVIVASPDEAQRFYAAAVAGGQEGIMLRDPRGGYRHGRTHRLIFKFKCADVQDCPVVALSDTALPVVALPDGTRRVAQLDAGYDGPAYSPDWIGRTVEIRHTPHGTTITRLRLDKAA